MFTSAMSLIIPFQTLTYLYIISKDKNMVYFEILTETSWCENVISKYLLRLQNKRIEKHAQCWIAGCYAKQSEDRRPTRRRAPRPTWESEWRWRPSWIGLDLKTSRAHASAQQQFVHNTPRGFLFVQHSSPGR